MEKLEAEIKEVKDDIEFLQGRLNHLLIKKRRLIIELHDSENNNEKQTVLAVLSEQLNLQSDKVSGLADCQRTILQDEKKDQPSLPVKGNIEKKEFTVIFTMPYQGIYSNEFEVSRIITGNPSIKYKRFRSGIEAEASLAMFRSQFGENSFDKETFAKVTENEPKEKSNLVPIGIKFRPNSNYPDQGINFEQWKIFANVIRKDDGSNYETNRYFSFENGIVSKYNLLAGINPRLCYNLYLAGLVENIYPGKDLAELEFFPKGFQKAIENFRRRALRNSDKEIFLSIQASVPWWENGEFHTPYCFIRLGTRGRNEAHPEPRKLEEFDFKEESLEELRIEGLWRIFQDILSISPAKELRINYKTTKVIVVSFFNKKMSEEDTKKYQAYKNYFLSNTLDADKSTRKKFCEKVKEAHARKHTCQYCITQGQTITLPTDAEMQSQEDPCEE